jgi:hypothetical protein
MNCWSQLFLQGNRCFIDAPGNADLLHANFAKCRRLQMVGSCYRRRRKRDNKLVQVCSAMKHFQNVAYAFEAPPENVMQALEGIEGLAEEALFNLSLRIEPRDATVDQIL